MNSYQSNLFWFSWEIRRGTIIHCNSYSDSWLIRAKLNYTSHFTLGNCGSVFCTGKLQQFWIIFRILIYAKVCKVYYIYLISLRDFENASAGLKVILIVRFIFCWIVPSVHINWSRWSNKGYVPLTLIDFYFTKQNLHRKTKFRLEDTDFIDLLRFQDLIWVGLRFSDRNPVHRNLLIKSLVVLHLV